MTIRSGCRKSSTDVPSRRNSGLEATSYLSPFVLCTDRCLRNCAPVCTGTVLFSMIRRYPVARFAIARATPSIADRSASPFGKGGVPTQIKIASPQTIASSVDPKCNRPFFRTAAITSSRCGSKRGITPLCSFESFSTSLSLQNTSWPTCARQAAVVTPPPPEPPVPAAPHSGSGTSATIRFQRQSLRRPENRRLGSRELHKPADGAAELDSESQSRSPPFPSAPSNLRDLQSAPHTGDKRRATTTVHKVLALPRPQPPADGRNPPPVRVAFHSSPQGVSTSRSRFLSGSNPAARYIPQCRDNTFSPGHDRGSSCKCRPTSSRS